MTHDEKAGSLHTGGPSPLGHDTMPAQKLGKQARKRIGTHLRAMYASVAQQPIPSRFTDLIAQLDDGSSELANEKA